MDGFPRSAWLFVQGVALTAMFAVGCGVAPEIDVRFEPVEGGFRFPAAEPLGREPFDALCADMDLDGDDDLIVNWHHLDPLELFENRDGVFLPIGDSGLVDNDGLPPLFADTATMQSHIASTGGPGLYLWHGLPRDADGWRLAWKGGTTRRLEVQSNTAVVEVIGLAPGEFRILPDGLTVEILLPAAERIFGVQTEKIATRLRLELAAGPEPIFVGPERVRIEGRSLVAWKPDPHGLAWVDIARDARPELYVTRGAMMGTLAPPAVPKHDRYFVPRDAGRRYGARFALVPPDYGRGRRVEWVDVDVDGRLELSVGNKNSPNRLLDRARVDAAFTDRAGELGLDLDPGHVHAWGDFDGDGRDDLYYVDGETVRVLRNVAQGFVPLPQAALALTSGGIENIISVAALRLVDFDNDGRLDLWLTGHGMRRTHQLFLRRGDGFEDVTARMGLDAVAGGTVVVPADWDNDGFIDAVSFGPPGPDGSPGGVAPVVTLWRNRAGHHLEFSPLDVSGTDVLDDEIRAAAACDVNGDGRVDIVAIGGRRHLLRNVTVIEGDSIEVVLPAGEPASIGALVRAEYADGTVSVQRYGSASNSAYGQSLQPLRFASPARNPLERVVVRWPGTTTDAMYDAPDAGQPLVLSRPEGHPE